jgi:phenylpropionate dioxygenase-like ring-hydroxylating dioxygenase large terminal subunit
MTKNEHLESGRAAHPRRILSRTVPAEGEGGLFSQTWYPICLSSDVAAGAIVGKSFLDGRVVVFRGQDGVAQVVSAYCPHLGADLSVGCVVENRVRCAFHHWQFDRRGDCVRAGMGEPPPHGAALFSYPTTERYGIVWAFNGESPWFRLPDLLYPDEDLAFKNLIYPEVFNVDPWVGSANPADFQHLQTVHGFTFDKDPASLVQWSDHSIHYQGCASMPTGDKLDFDVATFGTNIFRQLGTLNGRWFSLVLGTGLPAPGKSEVFFAVAVRKSEVDEASRQSLLETLLDFERGLFEEDLPILRSAHFRPGVMTKNDKTLVRYFDYVRTFPRAHPGADFIV